MMCMKLESCVYLDQDLTMLGAAMFYFEKLSTYRCPSANMTAPRGVTTSGTR